MTAAKKRRLRILLLFLIPVVLLVFGMVASAVFLGMGICPHCFSSNTFRNYDGFLSLADEIEQMFMNGEIANICFNCDRTIAFSHYLTRWWLLLYNS